MPTTLSSDRYSAVSSTSSTTSSSTSSNSSSNNTKINNSQSQLSSTFLPLRSATSSIHLSKITNKNSRSMQSLQLKKFSTPIARISPIVINKNIFSNNNEFDKKQETWISCEELETIEKRFNDLLHETTDEKKSPPIILNNYQQRSNSCDRLLIDNVENVHQSEKNHSNTLIYDNNTNQQTFVLSANDILKVESSYRSIGTQVFACRCLCDLYITTIERLSKLEDWIPFHQGLPVWLLNSGVNEKRQTRLSLILAEHGSGFPIWQDTINGLSNVKQTRPQHMTFTLSDQVTLAVLRFRDLSASKEFYSIYKSISNDKRYEYLFSKNSLLKSHRSSSCGSLLKKRRKTQKHISKSSISNPCQFQHITSVQLKDRHRLISLDQCLVPTSTNYLNKLS